MRVGQTVITALLLGVAATRAVLDGTPGGWVVAASVLFAGWYAVGLVLVPRAAPPPAWWLVGLALIWVGAVVVSAEFVWLAFPLWLFAGYALRTPWAMAFATAVFAVVIAAPVLHGRPLTYADVIGPLVGGIFALGISRGYLQLVRDARERERLVATLVEAQRETAALQDELARTQRESGAIAERTRLSRDIHDTVAQSLTSIGMIARGAREAPDALATAAVSAGVARPDAADTALAQIEQLSRDALVDVRRIVAALVPAALEAGALAAALARMLDRFEAEAGVATDLRVDESLPALPTPVEVALLRTAQSALANVRVHAAAGRVVVSLVDAEDTVRLDVVDDGAGFDAGAWAGPRAGARDIAAGGYGLLAMRDRLRELGGGLEVESAPGEGTALSAWVPLAAATTVASEEPTR